MQSLVIIIILLSLIGVYINMSTTALPDPKLGEGRVEFQEANTTSGAENNEPIANNTITANLYDAIGNPVQTGSGLENGTQISNIKVNSGNEPDTRPTKWMNSSKKIKNQFGLTEENLSHEDNFPYDPEYMSNINSQNRLNSMIDVTTKRSKGIAQRGYVKPPTDTSGLNFSSRALAIIKNQVANQNKEIPYLNQSPSVVEFRKAPTIHRVLNDTMEFKVKPDYNAVNYSRDIVVNNNNANSKQYSESNNAINAMSNNNNF